MNTNPYQPPTSLPERRGELEVRDVAEKRLQLSIVILLIAGLFNVAFFCTSSLGRPLLELIVHTSVNFGGTLIAGYITWRFAMPTLESVSGFLCEKLSREPKREHWIRALHSTLMTTIPFAIAGALLWCTWVYLFYVTRADFYRISVPIGICAHVLAASIYLQLVVRWWKIERIDEEAPK